MKTAFTIVGLLFISCLNGQTIGGSSTFSFLKLPNTPQLTALGSVNTSNISNDVGLAFNNPALLNKSMSTQINAVFNSMYAGIDAYHLSGAYHHENLNTNFLFGLHYLSYGEITQTDPIGNVMGTFRANDFVMQVGASRTYLEKWQYGATLKFISSNYGQYRSNGIAVDVGVLYHDTSKLFSASVIAKNMGGQLKEYDGATGEDLPFDLQIGITKRLEKAPFGFSITAHHLHQFDIRYNDTTFNNEIDPGIENDKSFTFDKIFRHFVFATQIYAGKNIEITAAYNHLRRQELNIGQSGNGLNGFSIGVGAIFKKLQIRYARSHYQNNTGYNQIGINLRLKDYFGF